MMIDLRKAFDLISHEVLLQKLRIYGVSNLHWFESYLSNRQQMVSFDGHLSCTETVISGVPQGSILGPLYFIIFMNDLVLEIENTEFDMYADDSTLYDTSPLATELSTSLSQNSTPICGWIKNNRMVLNVDKTEVILIGTKKRRGPQARNFSVSVQDTNIKQVESHKLLGLHIDKYLDWSVHVQSVCKKISSKLFLFRKLKHLLPCNTRLKYFNSMIQPHIDYCLAIYGSPGKEHLKKMHRIHKQFGRAILVTY